MRTKNLNLKKKIAFIASVAMIATTAAYLPAEVTQNIGGVIASANTNGDLIADTKAGAIEVGDYLDTTDATAKAADNANVKINLFKAYVQVNGKFIGHLDHPADATKTYPEYQLFTSLADIENANAPTNDKYVVFGEVTANLQAATEEDYNTNIVNDLFDVKAANKSYTGTPVSLPSIVKSTDKVTVKFVGNDKVDKTDADFATKGFDVDGEYNQKGFIEETDSVEVKLDGYGFGQIEEGAELIEVIGADYKEKNGVESGNKETIDLSGLKFKIADEAAADLKTVTITKSNGQPVSIAMTKPGTVGGAITTAQTSPEAILADKDIKPYEYVRQSVNGTYCNTFVAKLTTAIEPGKQIVIDLDQKTTEEITGASDGKVTVTMGKDGVGKSGVVAVTDKTSGKTVNYVFVVLNDDLGVKKIAASAALKNVTTSFEADTKFSGIAGVGGIDPDNGALTFGAGQSIADNKRGNIRVTSDQVAMQTLKGEKFVQKYTIATNDIVSDYSVTEKEDFEYGKRHLGFEMHVPGFDKTHDKANDATLAVGDKMVYVEYQNMPATPSSDDFYWTDGNKIGIKKNGDGTDTIKFYPKAGQGANYTTPILAIKEVEVETAATATAAPVWKEPVIIGYVQFDFTTQYELPIFNASSDNGTAVDTTDLIGYAKVGETNYNGLDVTRPENAALGGWLFKQFNIVADTVDKAHADTQANTKYTYKDVSGNIVVNADDGKVATTDDAPIFKLYSAASDIQAINKSWGSAGANYTANMNKITPNSYIVAEYENNEYSIDYDGNGGYFTTSGVTLKEDKDGNTTLARNENVKSGSDTSAVKKTGNAFASGAVREGFTFKGWNTDKNASTGMTYSAFKEARPSEKNGKVTLYAIWKADEVTVEWRNLGFDAKGRSLVGSVSTDYPDAAIGAMVSNEDTSKEYKAGEKFGELPVPTLRGYSFEGWYLKKTEINPKTNVTDYTAIPVTEDTVIDSEFIDTNKKIVLYAKFTQNTYTVTNDYGTGKLDWQELTTEGTGDNKIWKRTTTNGTFSVTDKEYKAGPTEIASYRYNADKDKVLFFDADDNDITDDVTNLYDVVDGSGQYNVFQGFYINDDTTAIKFEDLSTQLAGFAKLDNLKLTAHFEAKKNNSTGSMFLDTNGGEFYICQAKSFTSPVKYYRNDESGVNFNGGGSVAKDRLVNSTITVDKNTVKCEGFKTGTDSTAGVPDNANTAVLEYIPDDATTATVNEEKTYYNSGYYVVARPGYTFTGWYTTPDCKTEFDFKTAKYEAGVEHKAYAGWKANNTTRYTLRFNLMNKNGSFIPFDAKKDADNPGSACTTSSEYEFETSFMGTTGTLAKASEKEFEWNGKTYVFDAVRSADAVSSKTINAEFEVDGVNNAGGANLDCLDNGKFALDVDEYTIIEGVFVEKGTELQPEPEEGDLEAATDVKVAGGVVTWKAAKGAASYRYKVIDKNGNVKYAAATVKGTSQTLAVADIPADDYKLAVIAIAKDGKTTKTTEPIEVKVAKTNLTAPTDVKWANGVLTWKASTDAHHYNVKKVYANGNVKYVGGTADATLDLAAESVDFTAYVIAVDANGKTATSTKGAKVAADTKKVLGVVTDAKYDAKDNTVSWTAVANAKSYNICKMVNGKKFWVTGVKDTSYKFENKTPAFNYYVVAVAEDGDYTIGTFNAYPTMATDVVVTEGSKNVTWKAAEGAKYYKIGKVSADGKKVVWNNNKIEGTKGTFSYACTAGQKVVVMAVFKDEAKNLQTTRSATVVAAAAKADK